MKQNIKNEKTVINFIWEIDYAKWGVLEKIIDIHESRKKGIQKTLKPEDIIPNYGNDPKLWARNKFFLQTIASWAAKYRENPVRLIVNYSNFFSLDTLKKLDKSQNKEHFKSLSKKQDLIKYIQKKYETDIILEDIQNEYKKTFKKLEEDIKALNKNFEIKEFDGLVKEYVSKNEIKENQSLENFLSDEIFLRADKIDLFKLFVSYYGFGYEKNLVIDMDITPKTIKDFDEIENQKKDMLFGQRTHFENQLCSTTKSKVDFFETIFDIYKDPYSKDIFFYMDKEEKKYQEDVISQEELDQGIRRAFIKLTENRRLHDVSSWDFQDGNEKITNEPLYLGESVENYWPMDGYELTEINKKIHDQLKNKNLELKDSEQFNDQKKFL